jgi:hypothetical protein
VPDTRQSFRQLAIKYSFVTEASMGAGRALRW